MKRLLYLDNLKVCLTVLVFGAFRNYSYLCNVKIVKIEAEQ